MITLDMPQRSEEWFLERCGNPGASNFNKIVTMKGEPSKQGVGYMHQLAAEAITGKHEETYTSKNMKEGIEREPECRCLYEFIADVAVEEVGIIYPDEDKKYHCSPDGLIINGVAKPRGLEMKNVIPKTQVEYLLANRIPPVYYQQIQGSMLITGFDEWDFMSYSPGLPPLIISVKRDRQFIKKLKDELNKFVYALSAMIKELKEIN